MWLPFTRRSDFARFEQAFALRHPHVPVAMRHRLARCYGSRVQMLLANGPGAEVVPGLHEAELNYLHAHEWAREPDDVLWRRTKLGLHLTPAQREQVALWCAKNWRGTATTTTAAPPQTRPSETSWN